MAEKITVETIIDAPLERVWEFYTQTEHVKQWNNASEDWHTPRAENDLQVGGRFTYRMESKDGNSGFDFSGVYDEVEENEIISYTMDDGRKVEVMFGENEDGDTRVKVTFEPEMENSIEMQRNGWQAILNNFKNYVENQ